jgi:hypothetical protein
LKASHCGSCETASKETEESKDRELTAVRPNIGNLEGLEEERERMDREMAERVAAEEMEKMEESEEKMGAKESTEALSQVRRKWRNTREHTFRLGIGASTVCLGRLRVAHTERQMQGKERNL